MRSTMPVKQTPSRPGGRFFKSSSVEKKAKKFQTPKATEGTNWLDSDDVFGFDSMWTKNMHEEPWKTVPWRPFCEFFCHECEKTYQLGAIYFVVSKCVYTSEIAEDVRHFHIITCYYVSNHPSFWSEQSPAVLRKLVFCHSSMSIANILQGKNNLTKI